jgi:cytochrome c-type biogenesis protein CcmH/NrfG
MSKTRLSISATSLIVAALPAFGAGGGGGSESASTVALDPEFRLGIAEVESKNWQRVIARMGNVVARDPKNADAWNYLGYAYRQIGDMDNSFRHYETAVQINPKHRGAHEYLGEAYLQVGKLAQAEEQLRLLDNLCLLPCEEYSDLKEQIAEYKRAHQASASR